MKRLFAHGNELHAEMAKANAFTSMIRGDDAAAPAQAERGSGGEEEAAG